jgi:hypothetical protein
MISSPLDKDPKNTFSVEMGKLFTRFVGKKKIGNNK